MTCHYLETQTCATVGNKEDSTSSSAYVKKKKNIIANKTYFL